MSVISGLVAASGLAKTCAASHSTDANVDNDPSQLTGTCPTHDFILKKSGIQSLLDEQTPDKASNHTMQYSTAVLFVEVKGVPVAGSQFKRILQTFTFLEG